MPARQWELVDVGLNGPAGLPAPLDVDAVAHLQGPDGVRMKVPLFFNGGTEFVLRFTPPSPGLWRFKTESPVAALSGLTGAIKAEAPDVVGVGTGRQQGSAVLLNYKIKLTEEAGGHVLDTTDWMYLTPNGSIMNRSQFRKFGIKVAELVATMRPREAA